MSKRGHMMLSGRAGMLRTVALGTAIGLSAGLFVAPPAQADDAPGRPKVKSADRSVKTTPLRTKPRLSSPKAFTRAPLPSPSWPKPGSAEVVVPGAATTAKRGSSGAVRAGRTPVWVAAPDSRSVKRLPTGASGEVAGRARVRIVDRSATEKAGLTGVVFTVGRTDTPPAGPLRDGLLKVGLDYSEFATAFGGSYGSSLRLVQYPACVLTTPSRPQCRTATPIQTLNDTEHRTLSADVIAAPEPSAAATGMATVLAAEPDTSSDKGDYKATSLAPSSTIDVGTQTGELRWSQPMRVPPVPGSLTPNVTLSYNSGSIDGRTSNTNNQSSWAGDGFELWPGYIERGYKTCEDDDDKDVDDVPKKDGVNYPGDRCWGYDNATISWNGKGGELIPAGANKWRLRNDDGTRIEKLTDAGVDNGDNDNEYWKITTTDGTQYYFGYDKKIPGGSKSTWTAPVYGDDSSDPCHKSSGFADSWCQQAWRWNLDYVEDRNGNAITYTYTSETNHYGRNLKASDQTPYVRGGTLATISYGLRKDTLSAKAPAKVVFDTAERCLAADMANCAETKIDTNRSLWQDTPWYLNCGSTQDCELGHGALSPTFWSRKRLTKVTTQIANADTTKCSGKAYCDVDSWALTHQWGEADADRSLLMTSVQHTGHGGATTAAPIELPKTTFAYKEMPNRVDKLGDTEGPYYKYRIVGVNDEYGGQLSVNYLGGNCSLENKPKPESNTTRCMPVMWEHGSLANPSLDWFHKYVVASTAKVDRTGYSPQTVTAYDYQGPAAWHFDDDDGLTRQKYKTWGQWRGYGKVSVTTGGLNAPKTQTDYLYLRGMHGDWSNRSGGRKEVMVSDEASTVHSNGQDLLYQDHESLAGFELKKVVRNGADGPAHAVTLNVPWQHQTASRTRPWGTTTFTVTANLVAADSSSTHTAMGAPGSWRTTRVNTRYDTETGRKVWEDDQGDTATGADDRCTRTEYADNDTRWFKSFPSRVDVVSQSCSVQNPDRQNHTVSDTSTTYDANGNSKQSKRLVSHDGSTASQQVLSTTQLRDVFGRPREMLDTKGQLTTTSYVENTSGLTTSVKTVSPPVDPTNASSRKLETSQTLQPAWGQPTAKTDAGTKRTDLAYDPLGRLIKVWLPDRPRDRNPIPNIEYTYQVTENKIVTVGMRTVTSTGGQTPYGYTLYDASLRARQTQDPGPQGGRLVTDTFFDAVGKVQSTYASYHSTGAPEPVLMKPGQVEAQTRYTYDGLGRVLTEELADGAGDAATLWQTTTSYPRGDTVHVQPPEGGTPTSTVTDARGNTTKLIQHGPNGKNDTSTYGYDHAGRLKTITGPGGKTWTYNYDQLGRKTGSIDPDRGTDAIHYDEFDRVSWTQDARGQKIFTSYDGLGRTTATRSGSATGPLLTSRTYDTVRAGQLTSASRWAPGPDGKTYEYTSKVDVYDALNRPTTTTVTIPAEETLPGAAKGLNGSYTFNTVYNPDGTVQSIGLPAAGGLASEVVRPGYDELKRATTLTGLSTYVTHTQYSLTGKPEQYQLEAGAKKAWLSYGYQNVTQRLKTIAVERQDVPGVDLNATYDYDNAGNVRSIVDDARANAPTTDGGTRGIDTQCFRYDHLRRLTEAWAQNGGTCPNDPNYAIAGGPAPYRISYQFADDGSRIKEEHHTATGLAATRNYAYAGDKGPDGQTIGGSVRGHMLGAVTQTGTSPHTGPAATETYTYDEAGNTQTRKIGDRTQTYVWDAENEIQKITDAGNTDTSLNGDTTFVYTPDGDRLIRRDPTATTLYLPGMELTLTKTSGASPTATRYYSHNGQTIAQRTTAGVTLLAGDHQGTSQLTIDAADNTKLTQRRQTPYGQPRDTTTPAWPTTMDKGFVGGTKDRTGLTHLSAREYDPNTGRFISVDPVFNLTDPQSWNGYTYADNTPVTTSDPSGLDNCSDGACGDSDLGDGGAGGYPDGHPNEGLNDDYDPYNEHPDNRRPEAPKGAKPKPGTPVDTWKQQLRKNVINLRQSPNKQLYAQWLAFYCYEFSSDTSVCNPKFDPHKAPQILQMLPGAETAGDVLDGLTYASEGNWPGVAASAVALGLPVPVASKFLRRLFGVGKACTRNSFTPDTQVLMADGTKKAIKDIEVGDEVIATDPETGQTQSKPVLHTIKGSGKKRLVQITIDATASRPIWSITKPGIENPGAKIRQGNSTAHSVTATAGHLFWVANGMNKWIKAEDLKPGMWLRTSTGTYVQVKSTRAWSTAQQRVRNLTVADRHTYYVSFGSTYVLVHNDDPPIDLNGKSYTVWQRGPYRIDIEARNGMKQMHFQEQIPGVKSGDAPKYQYNPATGEFDGMPKALQRDLRKNYPDYGKGLKKGAEVFDRVIGECP
ncbi:RHS repeat-associated core domain-containing protein [Spirillospora sp. NPDC048911]|uniref:RHS repeat-associated core domain-containing protein n=1 Tax=Spirillospora sp. NPDC048911 TaxID=3364527 RepID=UPI003721264A